MIRSKIQGTGKLFVSLLFLLILSSLVIAQPFISQSSDESIAFSIAIPSEQVYRQHSSLTIAVSVFNTTGLLLSPQNGVSCRLQFFDENNNLVINNEMGFSSDQFNYTIPQSLVSKNKRQEYKIFCNSTTQGGFRTGEFGVSESGFSKDIEQVLLILFLSFAVILIWLAYKFINLDLAFASGMLFCIAGIYLYRHGYLGISNFLSESIAIIILGIGCVILFKTAVEYMNEASR